MQLTSLFAPLLLVLLHLLPGPPARAPRYQTADPLAPYVGTWIGHTPTGEFTLVLEERKQFHVGNSNLGDLITGLHSYVTQSGPVNESLSLPANKIVLSCAADENNPGGLYGSSWDDVNRRRFRVKLSFANADKTKLLWLYAGQMEAWSLDPAKPVLPGLSVPTSLVLTKVK